jgi:guanosine-3',5'-bis(diphosphate) 3'-pyrophosphohydrolase
MFGKFIEALKFASEKHVSQRRKGCADIPYINHPIRVAELLFTTGGITDTEVLSAAILHDVLEDTDTIPPGKKWPDYLAKT